jgi:predicted nucleotidyltransferase component of viral defense system
MMDIETIRSLAPSELRTGRFDKHLLKEYVETLALNWLVSSKWAVHLTFIGGTNLRLVRGLDRFSEDLDFDVKGLEPAAFTEMTDGLVRFLALNGLPAVAKARESDRLSAWRRSVQFHGLLHVLGLSPFKEERFLMKVECQDQKIPYAREMAAVSRFGLFFQTPVPPLPVLCAMKLSALLTRAKGRDFYDAMFLLPQTEPDYAFLESRHGIANKSSLKTALLAKAAESNLPDKVRDVRHLLFQSEAGEKILGFEAFVRHW